MYLSYLVDIDLVDLERSRVHLLLGRDLVRPLDLLHSLICCLYDSLVSLAPIHMHNTVLVNTRASVRIVWEWGIRQLTHSGSY